MASRLDVQNLSVTEAFHRGRLAMVEDGSWSLKSILDNAKFRVGVTVFPAGPAGRVTIGTTDGFGIYKGTRYPEAAWEFMKFLISSRYGRAMSRAHLLQPARASLVDELDRRRTRTVSRKGEGDGPGRVRPRASAGLQRDAGDIREAGRKRASWPRARGSRFSPWDGSRFPTCARFPTRSRPAQAAPTEGQGGGRQWELRASGAVGGL